MSEEREGAWACARGVATPRRRLDMVRVSERVVRRAVQALQRYSTGTPLVSALEHALEVVGTIILRLRMQGITCTAVSGYDIAGTTFANL